MRDERSQPLLLTRVLAALVFAPALLGLVVLGGTPLQVTCLFLGAVMLWEALRLCLPAGTSWRYQAAGFALGALSLGAGLGFVPQALGAALWPIAAVVLLAVALVTPGDLPAQRDAAAGTLLAVAYATGLIPLLYQLRSVPELGLGLALMALFCTWASDTGAYFAGRAMGRRKLYPRISPGKTLEGAVGGVVAAIVMALALTQALRLPLLPQAAISLGTLAATLGVLGDLTESLLKRAAGVKDSSALIPGHGGFLDRFDGVLFALFGVHAYTTWVLGLMA